MENEQQLFSRDGDRAVSPVIAVILMVAITVILAAVIAMFVLGIGTGDEPVDGAISVNDYDIGEEEIQLEIIAEGNIVSAELGGCAEGEIFDTDDGDEITPGDTLDEGDISNDDITGCEGGDTINVVAQGPDGNEEIVGSTTIS